MTFLCFCKHLAGYRQIGRKLSKQDFTHPSGHGRGPSTVKTHFPEGLWVEELVLVLSFRNLWTLATLHIFLLCP